MPVLLVVDNPKQWPLGKPGVKVVSAREYVSDPTYNPQGGIKVFNLCRSYAYKSLGYYVSLLGEARGHRPQPGVTTIQDLKSPGIVRVMTQDLDDLVQRSLRAVKSEQFVLSVYFGRNLASRYDRLASKLFAMFPAPLLRAHFARKGEAWQLKGLGAIPLSEVPEHHLLFLVEAADEYLGRKRWSSRGPEPARFDLAILHDPEEEEPASHEDAIRKFVRAAEKVGFNVDVIGKEDIARLPEFDALFIRVTTSVNHYSYRFSRRAAAEGLVVIDDPVSISRCMNKVYLAQRLYNHQVPMPESLIVHKGNREEVAARVGLPCILKQPDSSFSMGVFKVETEEELKAGLDKLLDESELVIAQEFVPTEFDWRVGILDGKPLYVSRYHMARGHWQIVNQRVRGGRRYGKVETIPWEDAPRRVVRLALKAAELMGKGLYGVDVKQVKGRCLVIEVNDNPTIEAGDEDQVLKDELYERIMRVFLERVEARKSKGH
ncbi:MAG: RimK family protein [Planctomycetota bacterium]|nr:RimK family protein [Planctomycetota bacterium]